MTLLFVAHMNNLELIGKRNNITFSVEAFVNGKREGLVVMWYTKIPTVAWLQYLRVEDHAVIDGESFKRRGIGTLLIYKSLLDASQLGFEDLQGNFNPIPNGEEERVTAHSFYEYLGIGLKDDQKTLVARIPTVIARCEEVIEKKKLKSTYREIG